MRNGDDNTALPVDISGLGIDELKTLQEGVEERLATLEAERREAGFEAMEEIARRHGLTKAEVAARFRGRKSGKNGPKHPVRYRNPENPSETWTGRGRRPNWVEAQVAAGKALEELTAAS